MKSSLRGSNNGILPLHNKNDVDTRVGDLREHNNYQQQ